MTYEEYKIKYGITLDPAQDIACKSTEGHILLLAVPGSGKTSVMTARLGYLVHGLGVSPDSILAVTYSVAGTREMKRRYENIFGTRDIEIRTINGFCSKVIGAYERLYGRNAFKLIENDGDTTAIIRGIMTELGGYPSENEIKDVKTALTYSRNMMLTDKEIEDQIKIEGRDFSEIFRRFRELKRENRIMDYDDQLAYGYNILCKYPEVNELYSGRFKYICVDEAQDTSKIQHMIIRKAAEKCNNLFMVGDEDQSIYGFRAAYPDGLLEFDKVYPDAKIYYIEKNYRSTETIVRAADKFISSNTLRREKHMTTDNSVGDKIKRTELNDLRELGSYVKRLASSVSGEKGETTAVLCRLNDSLIPFIDVLCDTDIPFCVREGDGLFFTHYMVNDIISIIKFAADPYNGELFEKLYYKFSAAISRTDCEYALTHNSGVGMLPYPEYMAISPVFSENTRRKMKKVAEALHKINVSDSYGAIKLVMSSSGYGSYISHKTNDLSKVNTLLSIADRFRSKKEFYKRLDYLYERVRSGKSGPSGIVLSTIHSAKGLEFDNVIVCDAKNGILPSVFEPADGKKYNDEELKLREEDRRLFYVAATRAKKQLEFITYKYEFGSKSENFDFVTSFLGVKTENEAKRQSLKPKERDIEKLIKAYSVGDLVHHKQFGDGVVVAIKGIYAEIRFNRLKAPKKLDLELCIENGLIKQI